MMHQSDPSSLVDFSKVRTLVIGDLMLDQFRYGEVLRLSPEAPVPVMKAKSDRLMLGGAGNVAANLASMGCEFGLIAVVGDDVAGDHCRRILAQSQADGDLLVVVKGRRTTVKTRLVAGSQQLLRFDEEDVGEIESEIEQALIWQFDTSIACFDIVAISDYAKGVLSDKVLAHVIATSRSRGVPVIVDPKRADMRAYAGATLIKPNRAELSQATAMPCKTMEDCERAARRLIEQTGADLLITMSEEGMMLCRDKDSPLAFPAEAAEVFDVSGAGDSAMAALCASIAAGHPLKTAVRIANVAAGIAVRKLGTATLTREEVALALEAQEGHGHVGVASRGTAIGQVKSWKREGLRVGFTNGCFDILHAGHVHLLRKARSCCDRLVVGLNSDDSISRIKGPDRPIQPQASRATVLAAIDAVDLVVVFDEDTPLSLIVSLLPDDLIKGADYTEDEVVGAREVKEAGGKIHLIELVPGLSTTAAVERIRRETQMAWQPEKEQGVETRAGAA